MRLQWNSLVRHTIPLKRVSLYAMVSALWGLSLIGLVGWNYWLLAILWTTFIGLCLFLGDAIMSQLKQENTHR